MIPSSGCPPWPPDHPRTRPRTGIPTPPPGARPEIVSHKDPETYHNLLGQQGVLPEEFAMVGNALHSDLLPVIEIGGRAFHVPLQMTVEVVGSGPAEESGFQTLAR